MRLVALVAALLALALPAVDAARRATAAGRLLKPPARRAGRGCGACPGLRRPRLRLEVEGAGRVERLLADDEEGSRHQRFILRLASGQTLLVAHNIDVAPRIADLRVGDGVAFRGVYEWSEQGGTVHWTHHDPSGDHAAGWLRHGGRTYQ